MFRVSLAGVGVQVRLVKATTKTKPEQWIYPANVCVCVYMLCVSEYTVFMHVCGYVHVCEDRLVCGYGGVEVKEWVVLHVTIA